MAEQWLPDVDDDALGIVKVLPTDDACQPKDDNAQPHGARSKDDLNLLLEILPKRLREKLCTYSNLSDLLEVVMDLGRFPEARFFSKSSGSRSNGSSSNANTIEYHRWEDEVVSIEQLEEAERAIGEFGGDNRAGVTNTLHRISAIRNRKGKVIGLTFRVGRFVKGKENGVEMIRELLRGNESILLLGRPGVGKTTAIREMARVMADDLHLRVVIVDTSNEIGGYGDVPHPAIGTARRMPVSVRSKQHQVMIEAVENHNPEAIIIDEVGTKTECSACRRYILREKFVCDIEVSDFKYGERKLDYDCPTDLFNFLLIDSLQM